MAHEELRLTWEPDQIWETRIITNKSGPLENPIWVPVRVPLWDANQEYRRVG